MRDGARLSASGGDIHHGAWRLGTFGRSVGSLLPIVATGRRYLYACKLAGLFGTRQPPEPRSNYTTSLTAPRKTDLGADDALGV
jgi:hypothetical protein